MEIKETKKKMKINDENKIKNKCNYRNFLQESMINGECF